MIHDMQSEVSGDYGKALLILAEVLKVPSSGTDGAKSTHTKSDLTEKTQSKNTDLKHRRESEDPFKIWNLNVL